MTWTITKAIQGGNDTKEAAGGSGGRGFVLQTWRTMRETKNPKTQLFVSSFTLQCAAARALKRTCVIQWALPPLRRAPFRPVIFLYYCYTSLSLRRREIIFSPNAELGFSLFLLLEEREKRARKRERESVAGSDEILHFLFLSLFYTQQTGRS